LPWSALLWLVENTARVNSATPNGFELTGDGPPPYGPDDNARVPRAGVRCSEGLGRATDPTTGGLAAVLTKLARGKDEAEQAEPEM